ncbi:MAG: sugar phosphate isomerase/epimerase family protein [Planctomycetota bacterium]
MKYAICNELYEGWPWEQVFTHAASLGYSGIEIAPFTLPANDAYALQLTTLQQIRNQAESHGLEIIGLHWLLAKTKGYHLTSPDELVRKKTGEYLAQLAKICHQLGGKIMVFGSPPQRNLPAGVTPDQAFDYAVNVFQSVAPVLESYQVTLAIEPLGPEETDFILTAEQAVEIAEAVDSDFVKLHLDVKAMSTESKPIPEIIRNSKQWLVHFHANDPNRQGPGMGTVDFEPIFRTLAEIDYQNWISVEVFDYSPGIDALAGKSIQYMRQFEN